MNTPAQRAAMLKGYRYDQQLLRTSDSLTRKRTGPKPARHCWAGTWIVLGLGGSAAGLAGRAGFVAGTVLVGSGRRRREKLPGSGAVWR